jgi:chromosome segregation protein
MKEELARREATRELDRMKERLNETRIDLARVETRREDLLKRILLETGWEEADLAGIVKKGIKAVEAGKWETDIARLKFLVDQSGAIDESVLEEYKETKERFEFLTQEARDLKEAMVHLKGVAKEMDKKIKTRFEEAFGFIDKKFKEYFQTIFGGGQAGLKLIKIKKNGPIPAGENSQEKGTDELEEQEESPQEDEETQLGVEISAVPLGKKISSLGMLSGGERALTSLALLFAVIAHNPPPFAVLDEVEAALDEANSARFGRIIRRLSSKTQFILITHNRQTMKEASLLYGVTMSDDGVSKLLSVRLDQVDEKGNIKK